MAEMDGLKKRVALIDLRLKKAHSARERESTALMETWQQIRDRFQDQSAEIVKLRDQVAELDDSRNDLLKMVHSLLLAVESGLDSMADETVPQIKMMAGQLLSNNKEEIQKTKNSSKLAISNHRPEPETVTALLNSPASPSFHDDLLAAIERTIDSADDDEFVDDMPPVIASKVDRSAPASPGIRNLIARIENAVGEEFLETQSAANDETLDDDDDDDDDDDEDLTRELREIEALRDELQGLRHRISAGAL
ncbi:MAG: hypothetical protein O3C34_07375 [Proteobacteria bacterium]|nr:hypothetical protein [Pseudomonadota bacterium]